MFLSVSEVDAQRTPIGLPDFAPRFRITVSRNGQSKDGWPCGAGTVGNERPSVSLIQAEFAPLAVLGYAILLLLWLAL